MKPKAIAIYLPQFHPIPENDAWWGKGFTEWTNVVKSKPLYPNHYQPHLPADLGFYDLRLAEARLAQEALAKQYGIHGFCYYHYWFNGKRLLHEPIDRKMKNQAEDLPFMLCWANENWSRAWDGSDKELLIQQHYSIEDDKQHIRFLLPFFKDERYIKVNGKPVFIIYKSAELPNVKATLQVWREEAAKEGLELYICRVERWNTENGAAVMEDGFDAAIDFQPLSPSLKKFLKQPPEKTFQYRWQRRIYHYFPQLKPKPNKDAMFKIDLEKYIPYECALDKSTSYKLFPGISPSWDNSSRRKTGQLIFENASPALYEKWLSHKLKNFKPYSADESFLFINAWNEWAEGNHLEPCQKWGKQYLEATKRVVDSFSNG